MTADKLKRRINEICTHITFEYNSKTCGVDPLSLTHFDMWYGEIDFTASSIDEVMKHPLFDGKSLEQIADAIEVIDW